MRNTFYVFREVTDHSELVALFSLRYYVLKTGELRDFIPENGQQMDMDRYDLYARHYGLFMNNSIPIGYMRIISDQPTPAFNTLIRISEELQGRSFDLSLPDPIFPVLRYCGQQQLMEGFIRKLKVSGQCVVEGSRLLIDPKAHALRMGLHLTESVNAAVLLAPRPTTLIAATSEDHAIFHRRYGYVPVPQSKTFASEGLGPSSLLYGGGGREAYLESLAPRTRTRLLALRQALDTYGLICFNPAQPQSFALPVQKGMKS